MLVNSPYRGYGAYQVLLIVTHVFTVSLLQQFQNMFLTQLLSLNNLVRHVSVHIGNTIDVLINLLYYALSLFNLLCRNHNSSHKSSMFLQESHRTNSSYDPTGKSPMEENLVIMESTHSDHLGISILSCVIMVCVRRFFWICSLVIAYEIQISTKKKCTLNHI